MASQRSRAVLGSIAVLCLVWAGCAATPNRAEERANKVRDTSSGLADSSSCTDDCIYANDGYCDDGSTYSVTSLCAAGTDCTDCAAAAAAASDGTTTSDGTTSDGTTTSASTTCTDTCYWAGDGSCDDGGPGSSYDVCSLGTDCTDCGARSGTDTSSTSTSSTDTSTGSGTMCTDTCAWPGDGECDDGGPGSIDSACALGTDCTDCGARGTSTASSDGTGATTLGSGVSPEAWAEDMATQVEGSARFNGYGEAMVAGPSMAPLSGCVGAWTIGGAAAGETAGKACVVVGLVGSETGAGVIAAGACGIADLTQIDWLLGAVVGSVSGLVACSAAAVMPSAVSSDYQYFDAQVDTHETLSQAGSRLRSEACPAGDATEANTDCWMYFHYTSADGFRQIQSDQLIAANGAGQVFLTWLPYGPAEAETSLFIGSPSYSGRGDFVIAFEKADPGVTFSPGTQWNELIHTGSLRFVRHINPIYMGPNPF